MASRFRMVGVIVLSLALGLGIGFRDPLIRARAFGNLLALTGESELLLRSGRLLERLELIGPVVVTVESGLRFRVDAFDFVDRAILSLGTWEPDSWDALQAYLPQGGVFVDVGAHVGYYSVKAAQRLGERGTVVAIEPNPRTLVRLRENIELNAFEARILVLPFAVSDSPGTLSLFLSPRRNTGMSSLSRETANRPGEPEQVQVQAAPLDDLFAKTQLDRIDLIKIDIEGAELLALRGGAQVISRFRPALMLEVIDPYLRSLGASEAELRAWLAEAGYASARALGGSNEIFLPVSRRPF